MNVLFDTNVLVHVYDDSVPVKQLQAQAVLAAFAGAGVGSVSTQILSEFFSVVTRRLRPPLALDVALTELERHARAWTVFALTPPAIIAAARAVRDHKLNFWDAQIWAVARLNHVDAIFSEDFNSGHSLGGVRFVNPFAPGFRLEHWLD